MNNHYIPLFEELDRALGSRFGSIKIELQVIGYVALELAGLPDRGTKDIDALETSLTIGVPNEELLKYLKTEFGRRSPAARKHGTYLDIVQKGIVWLPLAPKFRSVIKLKNIDVSRLVPLDVCVSKIFSNFQKKGERGSDRDDIINSLRRNIIAFAEFVQRLDEALPHQEGRAEAPDVFPKVLTFVDELSQTFGPALLKYKLPNWMENM